MERIIINKGCTSSCPLSAEAIRLYAMRSGIDASAIEYMWNCNAWMLRRDPILIEIIEELGARANVDDYVCLVVVDVPDEYHGVVKTYSSGEVVKFVYKEDHLRKLIRLGNEDDIVDYVAGRLV